MSLVCQYPNDLVIIKTFGSQFADAPFHLGVTWQRGQAVDRHHDGQLGRRPTTPHNAHLCLVARTATHNDLFDKAAQQRLAVFSTGCWIRPDRRKPFSECYYLRMQMGIDAHGLVGHWESPSRQRFLSATQLTESSFPSLLKLASD